MSVGWAGGDTHQPTGPQGQNTNTLTSGALEHSNTQTLKHSTLDTRHSKTDETVIRKGFVNNREENVVGSVRAKSNN